MNAFLKYIILNFWKIAGLLAGFLLGLFLVIFGFFKTLFILAVALLGFILGKWKDEGVSARHIIKKIASNMTINSNEK
jgi:uncharacterized membrane protein